MKKAISIRIVSLVLILLALVIVTGCRDTGLDDTVNSSEAQATPQPTAPEIKLVEEYSYLIDQYTLKLPGYERIERSAEKKFTDETARYTETNGIYTNQDAEMKNEAVLMFTGDLMCQTRQQTAALEKYGKYKFNDSFKVVKEVFAEADLVVGNLEAILSETSPYMSEEKAVDGKPHCNAPSTYLDALRYAGFDALMTANNHSCDAGVEGILQTHDHLNAYDFMHTGTFITENDTRFLLIDVNGIKVAIMSYATYFNTKDKYITQEGRDVMLNRYSKERVQKDVQEARSSGAEFVIAYNHWGTEYTNDENEKQRAYAQEMADAGVDYIIGSHPHALQRYDILTAQDGREVPIVYSMGNFVSHMTKTVAKDTIILRIQLKRNVSGKVIIADEGYIPCRVFKTYVGYNYLVLPISEEYNGGRSSKYFDASYERITEVMGDKIKCLP